MKTKKLLQLFCFSFLIIGFQNSIYAQALEIEDEKEWREEFKENHYNTVKHQAFEKDQNKEMMTIMLFNTVTALNIQIRKLADETKNIETLVRKKNAKGYRVIEEKTFTPGNKLLDYFLENFHPNIIISKSPTEKDQLVIKVYKLMFK
tara:strand:- start:363 stop:806 length:444 start_codon:yes stop_codon:yes gene_type:complete